MTFFLNREAISTAGEEATEGAPTTFGENYGINFEASRKLESMFGLEYEFREEDRRNLQEIERITGEKMDELPLELAGGLARRYAGEPETGYENVRDMYFANRAGIDLEAQDNRFNELKQKFPQIKTRQEVFAELQKKSQELNALRSDMGDRSTTGGWWGGFLGAMMGSFSERDPLNLASLGVGGFGRSLAAKVLTEAGMNSAVELADQALGVTENKRILGVPQTWEQVALDVAAAGVGAGIIRGGVELGAPIAKQVGKTAADYTKMSSSELLTRFRANTALKTPTETPPIPSPSQAEPVTIEGSLATGGQDAIPATQPAASIATKAGSAPSLSPEARMAELEIKLDTTDLTPQERQSILKEMDVLADQAIAERYPNLPPAVRATDIALEREAEFLERLNPRIDDIAGTHTRALDAAEEAINGLPERFASTPIPTQAEIAAMAERMGEATEIRNQLTELRNQVVHVDDPRQVKKALGYSPKSLSSFVKEQGGIVDEGGELASRGITYRSMPGLLRKGGESVDPNLPGIGRVATQRQVDYVKQQAFDAGYFPDKSGYDEITDSELYDAIASDLYGKRRYTLSDEEALSRLQETDNVLDDYARSGFYPEMSVEDIARVLVERSNTEIPAFNIADEVDYRKAIEPQSIEQTNEALRAYPEDEQILADYATLRETIDDNATLTIEKADGEIVTVPMKDVFDELDGDEAMLIAFRTCGI